MREKLRDRYLQLYSKSNRTAEEQIEFQRLRLALHSHYGKFGRMDKQ